MYIESLIVVLQWPACKGYEALSSLRVPVLHNCINAAFVAGRAFLLGVHVDASTVLFQTSLLVKGFTTVITSSSPGHSRVYPTSQCNGCLYDCFLRHTVPVLNEYGSESLQT